MDPNSPTAYLVVLCCVIIPFVSVLFLRMFLYDAWINIFNKFFQGPADKMASSNILEIVENPKNKKVERPKIDGVMVPAIIVKAQRTTLVTEGGKTPGTFHLVIDFVVDVKPEEGRIFQLTFRDEIDRSDYAVIGNDVVSEHGMMVWVVYDPQNPSRAYLDHYDYEHADYLRSVAA